MGVQVNLQDIQSGFLSASSMNTNNTLIETALNKALDRTGSSDNAMEIDMDMGLNRIFNLQAGIDNSDAVTLGQANAILQASGNQITSTAQRDLFTATAGQTVFTFTGFEYIPNTNALIVFVNGVYQISGTDYTEDSTTTITFTSGLTAGDIVVVIGARFNAEVFATEASTFADAAEQSAADAEAAAGYKLGVKTVTNISYTLLAEDEGDLIRMNNASANTVNVPTNASVPFEIGTVIHIRQIGEGTTTISPTAGVTINTADDDLSTGGDEVGLAIVKVGTDEWDLVKAFVGLTDADFEADLNNTSVSQGYQRLPSGLLFQWGIAFAGDTALIYSFPIDFTTAVFGMYVGQDVNDTNLNSATVLDTNAYEVRRQGAAGNEAVSWFAIGV